MATGDTVKFYFTAFFSEYKSTIILYILPY